MKRFSRSGFTLVEISLVLVIIGLIVGGIVVGQSVMRSSQVQSVITDVNTYSNAIRQFQQKYNYLPGDMPTATTFWGVNSSVTHNDLLNCAWQGVTIASTTSTCDGNGDGSIDGTNASTSWTNEAIMAWKHMQNAGFLGAGKLTGLDYQCNGCIQVGTDVPASRVQGAGFTINNTKNLWAPLGGAYVYPWGTASYQHVLQFGTSTDTTGATLGPALTTDEAYSIDSKIDDGMPGTGSVVTPNSGASARQSWGPNCSNSTNQVTATYSTGLSGPQCSLFFELGF